ncbi:4-hydroxy-tetrahydrodipicolinate synthase [Paenibacillus sp. OSY-SE]|uniref:4-hydroxy-tetrahydrodipicolinate synthase n=1 Tax=Paenibacillus sp. OSY-SE TaxID=1196323 RepID=UPI0002D68D47|nr:4-hydroxy-tetrahydrodipicolinate synthase [Paenibacillus sp. OSY-SE]
MDFGRMITAMVTPFDENEEIHWYEVERLLDYLIEEQQSDSLVVCGTTGESPTLTDEEKLALFRFSVEKANGRARIIAGTGSNNTAHSVHMTKLAEEAGVDGILAVVPYYNKPSQEGLYRHFKTIADSTSLPVIVYNVPGRTVASLSVETTLRLAEIPNIVATKECASVDQMSQLAARAPESFRVYSGDDPMTLPLLAIGGYGIISVASHLIGAQMKKMIESYLAGQPAEAARLHQELYPVFKGLFEFPSPVPVKYAMQLKGFDVGGVRLPLVEPTDSEAASIRQLVQSIEAQQG